MVLTGGRGRLVVCRRRAYIIFIEIDAVRRCHCYLVIAAVVVGRREISIIMCARVSVCACVRCASVYIIRMCYNSGRWAVGGVVALMGG